MLNNNVSKISKEQFAKLINPREHSRFVIALCVCIPVIIITIIFTIVSFFTLLLVIASIVGLYWFGITIAKANLIANSVKVSEKNFKEIHEIAEEVKYILDYEKPVDIYIIEEGTVNAFLAKFFQTKFIILNSALVEDMIQNHKILQMKWIIARFIGALKAKHFRIDLLRLTIEAIESIKIFNFFILPYERATIYSGDQIGLAICNNLNQTMIAFNKFLVGNPLSEKVKLNGLMEQSIKTKSSFFAYLAQLYSTHPHTLNRLSNLLSFAKKNYPEIYNEYMNQQETEDIERSLENLREPPWTTIIIIVFVSLFAFFIFISFILIIASSVLQ